MNSSKSQEICNTIHVEVINICNYKCVIWNHLVTIIICIYSYVASYVAVLLMTHL